MIPTELLKHLGFSDKEVIVYITVLSAGKISVTDLARQTKIHRTTMYGIVKELMEKGLVRQDLGKSRGYVLALPPEHLHALVEQEEKLLDGRKRMVENAISMLGPLAQNARYTAPHITFIEEDTLESYLHERNPEWAKSISENGGIWWGFQDHRFVEHYGKWVDWSWRQPFQQNIALHLFTNHSAAEEEMKKKKYARRIMREWKGALPFTGTLWVNGEFLVMIVTDKHPYYLVEIRDATLAANLRSIFSALWSVSTL